MPWAGGTFTRTNGTYSGAAVWQSDAAAAIKIRADRHDTHDQDIAQGINNTLTKDGQNSPNQHISWGGFKITSLANGTAAGDAVNKGQLDAVDANANSRVLKAGDTMSGSLAISGPTAPAFTAISAGGIATSFSSADALGRGFAGTTTAHAFGLYTDNIRRVDVGTTGNVGIGKAASANILELQSGTNTTLLVQTTGGMDGIVASVDGLGGMFIGTGSNHGVGFYTNNSRRGGFSNAGVFDINGSFGITSVTVSSSAPGALAQGALYFRY